MSKRVSQKVNMYNITVTQLHVRILFGVVTVISVAMLATFALSHFESKQRINTLEHQQQLIEHDMSTFVQKSYLQRAIEVNMLKNIERDLIRVRGSETNARKELTKIKTAIEMEKYLDTSGRPDYALESTGGRILSIGSTQLASLAHNKFQAMMTYFLGFSTALPFVTNSPRYVIQPSIMPGECFAFIGKGEITIQLIKSVFIDAVGVEHILADVSPTRDISNAPNQFSVYGLDDAHDTNPTHLGDFSYDIARAQPLQVFPITNRSPFPIVRFHIHSNHGHANNTCVYRIRVHGTLYKQN